jgi:very-short-patch-repair endonuclease
MPLHENLGYRNDPNIVRALRYDLETIMELSVVGAAIDRWKKKLLDLSKRNRLLNFKPSRSTTIECSSEDPASLFQYLALDQGKVRLVPGAKNRRSESEESIWEDDPFSIGLKAVSASKSGPSNTAQFTPELATALTQEKLDRNAKRIAEQAAFILTELGVNTLFLALGFLEYFEADDSDQVRRAPLTLLPVALEKPRAGAPGDTDANSFVLRATGEDPVINPALVEYLYRDFGIDIPVLEGADPNSVATLILPLIAGQNRWAVHPDVALGFFSFQKFMMFKDLERNRDRIASNEFILQLLTGWKRQEEGEGVEIQEGDLDRRFPPEDTFQVVDADGTQTKAIEAVSRGGSVVIIGPPGTGKSQTITNLIANALAHRKTVLFVSEKMAALKVVFDRLTKVGLGEFCLEIHGVNSNKAMFYREIGRSLDRALTAPLVTEVSVDRLKAVREELRDYVKALHEPVDGLGLTPYQGYGLLAAVEDAPAVPLACDALKVTRDVLDRASRAVADFVVAWKAIDDPSSNPWRDTRNTFLSREEQRSVLEAAKGVVDACGIFTNEAGQVGRDLSLTKIETIADATRAFSIGDSLARSPGVRADVLTSPEWNEPPAKAVSLIEEGRRILRELRLANQRFKEGALVADHSTDIALIGHFAARPLRFLNGRYRAARRRFLEWRNPGYAASLREQEQHMLAIMHLQVARRRLKEELPAAEHLFGHLWLGEASDWAKLAEYISWVVAFRRTCVEASAEEAVFDRAQTVGSGANRAEALFSIARDLAGRVGELEILGGWDKESLQAQSVSSIRLRAEGLLNDPNGHQRWIHYSQARALVAESPAGGLLAAIDRNTVAAENLSSSFLRSFYEKWLDLVVAMRPALRDFHGAKHEQRIAEFSALDRRVLERNRSALLGQLRSQTQLRLRELGDAPGKRLLHAQIAKQRRHTPIREALARACEVIQAIKPCFMMSPLTVAQHLDGERHKFDLVIFDEASQVTPEDAVGAILRGRQLVVVGDPKQLPPTDFFMVESGERDELLDENGEPIIEDMESVLEQLLGAKMPKTDLTWHYRSRHESLIAFSNVKFYDSELCTFPSADIDTRSRGLQFQFVTDGVYEGAGINRTEARRVAQAVIEHARRTPELTLGVGTFNLRQQIAIQDEIDRLRREQPGLESFFGRSGADSFFVKNLENIQGDDRDVMFVSVTYAKGLDGKLRHNFGPINGVNGWRRLNVLVTRSKFKMVVFSSIHGDDIDVTRAVSPGARFFREYLTYAETGILADAPTAGGDMDSPFEREVYQELTRRGITLVPQVGVAGYRIDFGVRDDQVDGRYICGIECDGAAYHSADTARDRDRLREDVLSGLGWKLHRVWSTDWFKDRRGQIERLLARVEESRFQARRMGSGDPTSTRTSSDHEVPPNPTSEDIVIEAKGVNTPDLPELPQGMRYEMAKLGTRGRRGVLGAEPREVERAIVDVAQTESPVHLEDISERIREAFGDGRVGSKISRRIEWAVRQLNSYKQIRLVDEFVWSMSDEIRIRSRAGTDIPGDRIVLEEYRAAVLAVLGNRGSRNRPDLISDVRAVFGFARTGAILEERIGAAIDSAITLGLIGEGSVGLALRSTEADRRT